MSKMKKRTVVSYIDHDLGVFVCIIVDGEDSSYNALHPEMGSPSGNRVRALVQDFWCRLLEIGAISPILLVAWQ